VNAILCALATAYLVVLFARVLMSWFPIRPGTAAASIYIVLRDITEPVLAPLRRVIPPAGFIDLSVLVLFVALGILRGILCS
jgi:YggT family protein